MAPGGGVTTGGGVGAALTLMTTLLWAVPPGPVHCSVNAVYELRGDVFSKMTVLVATAPAGVALVELYIVQLVTFAVP